jgi:translation initiation factor 1
MASSFMLHKISQRSNSRNLLAYFLLFLYPSPMPKDDYRTVWSSEHGDQRKQKPQATRARTLPPSQQTAYLHRESKGRGGKTVTLVKNLVLSEADLKSLSRRLKQACGSGGTVKDGLIEIQGEHRKTIAEVLEGLGYKVKIAGG